MLGEVLLYLNFKLSQWWVEPLNFEPGRFEIIHRDLSFLKTNLFLFDQYVSLICDKFDPNVIYNNP